MIFWRRIKSSRTVGPRAPALRLAWSSMGPPASEVRKAPESSTENWPRNSAFPSGGADWACLARSAAGSLLPSIMGHTEDPKVAKLTRTSHDVGLHIFGSVRGKGGYLGNGNDSRLSRWQVVSKAQSSGEPETIEYQGKPMRRYISNGEGEDGSERLEASWMIRCHCVPEKLQAASMLVSQPSCRPTASFDPRRILPVFDMCCTEP